MKIIPTLLSFVLVFTFACSGDDSDSLGVDRSKALTELTTDEQQTLCESEVMSLNEINDDIEMMTCTIFGSFLGELNPEQSCDEFVSECITEMRNEREVEETDCSEPIELPANCVATVGELEACFVGIKDALATFTDSLTCENAQEQLSDEPQSPLAPDACLVLEEKCPGLLPDLEEEANE